MLLDYNQVDLAAYAEMLSLTVPIITGENRSLFMENCTILGLSGLLNVAEEAFALLVWENCFKQWKWIAEEKLNAQKSANPLPSLSVSSPPPTSTPSNANQDSDSDNEVSAPPPVPTLPNTPLHSGKPTVNFETPLSPSEGSASAGPPYDSDEESAERNDDNCTQIGPGYAYQYTQVRRDNRLGAGPWTTEGMERYNTIIEHVVLQRKTRATFEGHLKSYFKEQHSQKDSLLILKKKKKGKRDGDSDDGGSPRKVVVIDLFTGSEE